MTGFIEHLIEEQAQSRAYPDRIYSVEDTIEILEKVNSWFDEPGWNRHDIRQELQELIDELKKE
jgi:hypothetical protein